MVEMYVWLVVTLAVAVGVLLLAGTLSTGDHDDVGEDDEAAPSAWSSLWQDFLSATSSLRARWDRVRHRPGPDAGPDAAPQRISVLAHRPTTRRRAGNAPSTTAGPSTGARPAARPAVRPAADGTGWSGGDDAESNTSFDDFFEATTTSGPAYLDAAQLSEALNSLRR